MYHFYNYNLNSSFLSSLSSFFFFSFLSLEKQTSARVPTRFQLAQRRGVPTSVQRLIKILKSLNEAGVYVI